MTRYAVTGPRSGGWHPLVASTIAGLDDVAELTTGCQFGADAEAYEAGIEHQHAALHRVVVPTTRPRSLVPTYAASIEIRHGSRVARDPERNELLYVSGDREPGVWCYHARNGLMLDHADVLLAFPPSGREMVRGSGTWSCVREARRRGLEIRFFPLDGSWPWIENARDPRVDALTTLADEANWSGDPRSHDAVLLGHFTPFELARIALGIDDEEGK